jgi:hypothetical protein
MSALDQPRLQDWKRQHPPRISGETFGVGFFLFDALS